MIKTFNKKEEAKLEEGNIKTIDNEQQVEDITVAVSTEVPQEIAKVEKDDKQAFEEFKEMYKGVIDIKCRQDFGDCEDEKLWEDTAKELFLQSKNYILVGDEYKAKEDLDDHLEKIEESKELKTESRENDVENRINQVKEWKQMVEDAVEAEDLEVIVNDVLEFVQDIKDINFAGEDLYSGMSDVLDNGDAEARGPVTYVKSVKRDMQNILDDFIDNYEQAFNEESLEESKIEEAVEGMEGLSSKAEDVTYSFKYAKPFEANFGKIKIIKDGRQYWIYRGDAKDGAEYIDHADSEAYIEGWLHGAIKANNKVITPLTESITIDDCDKNNNEPNELTANVVEELERINFNTKGNAEVSAYFVKDNIVRVSIMHNSNNTLVIKVGNAIINHFDRLEDYEIGETYTQPALGGKWGGKALCRIDIVCNTITSDEKIPEGALSLKEFTKEIKYYDDNNKLDSDDIRTLYYDYYLNDLKLNIGELALDYLNLNESMKLNFITESNNHEFNYKMLDRLRTDCDYYLKNGNRNAKHLWANNEQAQIDEMRRLYNLLPEKPEWLSEEDINNYEKEMCSRQLEETKEYDTLAFAQLLPMSFTDMVDNDIYDYIEEDEDDSTPEDIAEYFIHLFKNNISEEDAEEFDSKLATEYIKYKLDNKPTLEESKDLDIDKAIKEYLEKTNGIFTDDSIYDIVEELCGESDIDKMPEELVNQVKAKINKDNKIEEKRKLPQAEIDQLRKNMRKILKDHGKFKDDEELDDYIEEFMPMWIEAQENLGTPVTLDEAYNEYHTNRDLLEKGTIEDFEQYNKDFEAGKFYGSEATPYKLDNIAKWINIRDEYTFINDYEPGNWYTLPLSIYTTKYGSDYIFIEPDKKLWRTARTREEFYKGGEVNPLFKFENKLQEDQYEMERRKGRPSLDKIAKEVFEYDDYYIDIIDNYNTEREFIIDNIAEVAAEYNLKEPAAWAVMEKIYKMAKEAKGEKVEESMISEYTLKEISKVLNSDTDSFKLKVTSLNTPEETKWLNLDREDLNTIYTALTGPEIEKK